MRHGIIRRKILCEKRNNENSGKLRISTKVILPNNILFVWKIDEGNTFAFIVSKIDRHITRYTSKYIKSNIMFYLRNLYIIFFIFPKLAFFPFYRVFLHAHAGFKSRVPTSTFYTRV